MKILIVDDDQVFAESISVSLVRAGYEVVTARNGKEAIRIWGSMAIDLVLTDIIMPDYEGLELIIALRKADTQVKIIAMSGWGQGGKEVYLSTAKNFGAFSTLVKPFTARELLAVMGAALKAP